MILDPSVSTIAALATWEAKDYSITRSMEKQINN